MALKLPPTLTGPKELVLAKREITKLEGALIEARVAAKTARIKKELPARSRLLDDLLQLNSLTADETGLAELLKQLDLAEKQAPRLRLSFAAEPDGAGLGRLVEWFRTKVSGDVLIEVGVQPTIAGGMILRTSRRRYDFSLRSAMTEHATKLSELARHVGE